VESPIRVLILGASYGSLFATKLAAAGHHATLVCLPAECDLINLEGTLIRLPVKDKIYRAIFAQVQPKRQFLVIMI